MVILIFKERFLEGENNMNLTLWRITIPRWAISIPIVLVSVSLIILPLVGCANGDSGGTLVPAVQPTTRASSRTPIPGGVSDDEIVVGMSAAFSGSSQGLGIELYRGTMAYIEAVNAAGGVHGRRIVILPYDDGYNPIPAIDNTVALVELEDVFLLYNYVGTPTVTRILPLLKRYSEQSVYLFFPFTGAQPQREPPYDEFVFNLRASYRQETAGLTDNFVAIGREGIAVFYQADAYGRSGWDGVKRALAEHGLDMVGEATYRRGASFSESFDQQVQILKEAGAEAVILIGSYQACAGFIRDARDAGWDVPIANVSFVGSENLLSLLLDAGQEAGKDYTRNLVNSQVVPSYEDTSLPAVVEYLELMDKYDPAPPAGLAAADYQSLRYSFVSFEGFLNAKLLVEILQRMGNNPRREHIGRAVENIYFLDLGIDTPVVFGPGKHQGLDNVYYTTVENDRFVPLLDWKEWEK
jgi:ABC-type branched-subunit amino acid transport system substrate-binding protein